MIKLLHTADIHANKTRAQDVCKYIVFLISTVDTQKIDAILITGDFWDCAIVNNSAFAAIIAKMTLLINKVPVYMIYGTPHHEIHKSLEIFSQLGAKVADSPTLWTFEKDGEKIDLFGVPEPRRSDFVGESAKDTSEKISNYLKESFNRTTENPCIVMFHGEVSGAVFQNGQTAASDTQLRSSYLNTLNPLYVACGHIHLPQDIGIFHYCGSPIPVNYGELHKPRCTILSIENGRYSSQDIDLPFCQNKVVDADYSLFTTMKTMNFKGSKVKINLTLTPEQRKFFRIGKETKELQESTGAEEIKLSLKTAKDVSVRSKEIAKTSSIEDKFEIYTTLNNIKVTQTMRSKLKEINDNTLIEYNFPSHSFELLSLSLRGAKGIKGKEEIFVDFSKYDDGVLGLIGANGTGKSTLIEFASPYPCLLTRSGPLRSHFYLKDSHRIVVYRDETGKLYKLTIQLAAHVDTGLVKYFAETSVDNGATWSTVKDCDGNLDTYKEYVNETFGSLPIYLRTAFFTKGKTKNAPDIASATKGERIELLSNLLGTDYLNAIHESIKEKLKNINKDLALYENIEEQKSNAEEQLERNQNNEIRLNNDLSEVLDSLSTVAKDLKQAKEDEELFNKKFSQTGNILQLKADNESRLVELTSLIDSLKKHKVKNDYYRTNKEQISEYLKTYETSKPMTDEIVKLSSELQDLSAGVIELTEEVHNAETKYENEVRKLNNINDKIREAEANAVVVSDTCPTCGAKLTEKKKKALQEAANLANEELQNYKEFSDSQSSVVSAAKKTYQSLKKKLEDLSGKKKDLQQKYTAKEDEFRATKVYLDLHEDYLSYKDYAEVSNLEADIERNTTELNNVKRFLETFDNTEIVDYKQKIADLESLKEMKENERVNILIELSSVQTVIKQLQETLTDIKQKMDTVNILRNDFQEYLILEQAFSNTGIQALELEAVAPDIAALTNNILLESYGDKFTVSFTTLRQGKTKIVDDFSIDVTNNETGWTTPIELLSEGEKVWIIQALYYAFSIIRMEKTGFCFKVRFVDESDGALDTEMRLKYLNMIKSAHKLGSSRLTVMITHSQELKDIIQQSISL